MDQLSRGLCVVIVISDGYLQSEYCMQELLWIYEHGEFRRRIFPIVIDGTKLYGAGDQIDVGSYWEQESRRLLDELAGKDQERYAAQYTRQRTWQRIADYAARLTAMLADMHVGTERWHRDSDFKGLLDQVAAKLLPHRFDPEANKATEELRRTVIDGMNGLLSAKHLTELKAALVKRLRQDQRAQADDPVAALCHADMAPRKAINVYLKYATRDCLGQPPDLAIWDGALGLLGWLLLLTIRPSHLGELRAILRRGTSDQTLEIPLTTDQGIEVVTASLSGRPARVDRREDHRWREWIPSERLPEGGILAADTLRQLKAELWVVLGLSEAYGERGEFAAEDDQRLRDFLEDAVDARDYRFLVIPAHDDSSAVANLREQLDEVLPGLWPLYCGCGSRRDVLLLRHEDQLRDIINSFLKIGPATP